MRSDEPLWPVATVFECDSRGHVWRVAQTEYQGRNRLAFWPWYRDENGELRPGSGKAGRGGFFVPIERVSELAEALTQIGSDNGPIATRRSA